MKRIQLIRLLAAALLLLALLATAACNQGDKPDETTALPDTIETVGGTEAPTEPETETEAPTVSSVKFPRPSSPTTPSTPPRTALKRSWAAARPWPSPTAVSSTTKTAS
ncbi:MAG: hypothetical protein J6B24_09000 [Clostridia bacterium]|nr:hypothetical protein [Clostridia bacterium]